VLRFNNNQWKCTNLASWALKGGQVEPVFERKHDTRMLNDRNMVRQWAGKPVCHQGA